MARSGTKFAQTPLARGIVVSILRYFQPPTNFIPTYRRQYIGDGGDDSTAFAERLRINTLRSLCLVSKEWLGLARGPLYHDFPELGRGVSVIYFTSALKNSHTSGRL